jgi:hypothetical protein
MAKIGGNFMNLKLEATFSAFYASKNRGFSLTEVLCALVILILVIFAAFAALNYTLKITVASRSRMGAFATAERVAVTSLALKEGVLGDSRVDFSRTPINSALAINGVSQSIEMEVFTYKEKIPVRLDRLMKRPTFVTFLRKATP